MSAILALLYFTSSAFSETKQQRPLAREHAMHSSEEEIKQIQRQLFILFIIEFPAMMLVASGLHAVFVANGNAVPDLLNNKNIAYGVIVAGGAVMAWCASKIVPLLKRKLQLENEENT